MTLRACLQHRADRVGAVRDVMMRSKIAALALMLSAAPAVGADEVHGTSDAFSGSGVAIAWGVLRGASEETTQVAMRVALEPERFERVAVEGVDPFTKARRAAAAPRAVGAAFEFRIARTAFADFPRTELMFFGAKSATGGAPDLVVYYLGVPDTTPEFPSEAALDAYLAERLAKLARGGAK
jgi:hypothetical protein